MEAYIQSQDFDVWEKVSNAYVIPNQINDANKVAFEANCKARNLIINGVGRSDYHQGSSTIKEVRKDVYKKRVYEI